MTVTEDLLRSVPFELVRSADGNADGLTLEGYAAVFNDPTRIDSWEGVFDEQIARGAFKKSIQERTPVLQFDHGRHASIGSIPIGMIESLAEDRSGLHVKARLHDNTLIQPVRDAIASGAIDGMSFRFNVVKEEWRDTTGKLLTDPNEISRLLWSPDKNGPLQRTLKELKVPELGPVVFPAYAGTSVAVRDLAAQLKDPKTRAELARMLGTPLEGDGAATPTEEPGDHSEDEAARTRAGQLRGDALLENGISLCVTSSGASPRRN